MIICQRCFGTLRPYRRHYSLLNPSASDKKPKASKWAKPEFTRPELRFEKMPAPRLTGQDPDHIFPRRFPLAPAEFSRSRQNAHNRPWYDAKGGRSDPRQAQLGVNGPAKSVKPVERPATRFPVQPVARPAVRPVIKDEEVHKRWLAKRAHELAQAEREARKAAAVEASKVMKQTKVKSAHLQKVRAQLYIPQSVTVASLAKLLNLRLEQLQDKMSEAGFDNNTHDYVLTSDVATLLAEEFKFEVIVDNVASFDLYPQPLPADTSAWPLRSPFVTIMGHVDHGKTTLLDTLRKSSVAAGEAGGITQAIGAFSVKLPGGKQITFLDTPGHSAFESMRQRGASVTDIVVLVVAADDSVMPQTKEAIKHAQKAGVNMIVAINKMDKPGVNVEKVKRDLMAEGIEVEDYGGDIQAIPVSGLTGKGLDDLENAIVSLAEILDIRAETTGTPEGWVIESSVKRGRGNVASMIVRRGTLKSGQFIVAGKTWCKIRAMADEAGKPLRQAGPGTPVEVTGWSVLPTAGDEVLGAASEKEAKQVVANRLLRAEQMQQLTDIEAINQKRIKEREDTLKAAAASVSSEGSEVAERDTPTKIEVPFVVKGDVSGSVEAVMDSIGPIGNDEVSTKLIDSGVGEVSESDVLRAAASSGKIVAFNVAVDNKARAVAEQEGIQIISHNIIYRLIDEIKDTLAGLLEPIREQRVLGEAEVLKIFSISTKGRETKNIAGCRITNGTINRAESIRVMRNKQTIFEGKLSVLKHVKEEVQTLTKGNECGMEFVGFQDFQQGDSIQCFAIDEIKRTL